MVAPYLEQAQKIAKVAEQYQLQTSKLLGGIDLAKLNLAVQVPDSSLRAMQQIGESFAKLQKQLQPWGEQLVKLNKEWDSTRSQLMPFAQQAAKAAFEYQSQFESIGKYALEGFQRIAETIPPNLADILGQIILDPEIFRKRVNEHATFCFFFGWPPLMHIPVITKNVEEILQTHSEEEARRIIDEEIVGAHDETVLQSILIRWKGKQFLHDYLPILESVIEAHQQGKYWLTTPTLLPHLEGILCLAGIGAGKRVKDKIKDMLKDDGYIKNNELVKTYLIDRVYKSYNRGDPLPFELSRHAILHGDHLTYGEAKISLKVILLFDYLVDVVDGILNPENDGA